MISTEHQIPCIAWVVPPKQLLQIVGFNVPKLPLGYEACRGGGLRINSDHVGIFKVCKNLREFSLFASIRKAATTIKIT